MKISTPAVKSRKPARTKLLEGDLALDQIPGESRKQAAEPKTPGRKKKVMTPQQIENQRLIEENQRLKFELRAQQLREEIGLLMPHLLKEQRPDAGKKTKKKR